MKRPNHKPIKRKMQNHQLNQLRRDHKRKRESIKAIKPYEFVKTFKSLEAYQAAESYERRVEKRLWVIAGIVCAVSTVLITFLIKG